MLRYELEKFDLTLYRKYVQDIYAGNDHQNPLSDYHVANMAITYRFNGMEFHLKLLNILDRKYEYLPGFRAPGFHALGGMNFSL